MTSSLIIDDIIDRNKAKSLEQFELLRDVVFTLEKVLLQRDEKVSASIRSINGDKRYPWYTDNGSKNGIVDLYPDGTLIMNPLTCRDSDTIICPPCSKGHLMNVIIQLILNQLGPLDVQWYDEEGRNIQVVRKLSAFVLQNKDVFKGLSTIGNCK